jgi:hypothetical protein
MSDEPRIILFSSFGGLLDCHFLLLPAGNSTVAHHPLLRIVRYFFVGAEVVGVQVFIRYDDLQSFTVDFALLRDD